MITSDPFWVVVGRYVARVTQPFPYRPYDHTGVFLVAIGAASPRSVWGYAEDQNKGARTESFAGLLRTSVTAARRR